MYFLHSFLLLSRGKGLPTVWSHCLAGWWLGGGSPLAALPWLLAGATFLYLGGTFTNDVFDLPFDREHRRARPIPSGALSADAVWRLGWTWFALGLGCFFWLGVATGVFGLLLTAWILIYNATHRLFLLSPALLGFCRFFLYLAGGSAAEHGVAGWCIWGGIALAIYYVGADCLSERPSGTSSKPWPAVFLLFAPVLLALVMNGGEYRSGALLLSAVLGLWIMRSLRPIFMPAEVEGEINGLFAGMIFVDWLAVADAPRWLSGTFIALFFITLLFQRLEAAPASAHSPATSR